MKTWAALAIVYVVWGSTYLAIKYVVAGLPPLMTAGVRFLVAAAIIAAYLAVRRGRTAFAATNKQWAGAAAVGLLLLLGGNGGVMLAERHHLPSGLTALVVAGVPLYVVALRWLARDRPSARTLAGVGVGFLGLSVLLLPGARPDGVAVGPALLVVLSSLLWSTGSFLASRVQLPQDTLAATVGEMVGGGIGLAIAGLLSGEHAPRHHVPTSAWVSLAYLVVFGSVVAFTAYSWLLHTAPLSQVATYAYVNPVVAVVLGALVAGESITVTGLIGGLVTVVAVFIVVGEEGRRRLPYVPIERQGRLRSSAT